MKASVAMTYEEMAVELDTAIESTKQSTNRLQQIVDRLTSLPVRRECSGDTRIMRKFKKVYEDIEAGRL